MISNTPALSLACFVLAEFIQFFFPFGFIIINFTFLLCIHSDIRSCFHAKPQLYQLSHLVYGFFLVLLKQFTGSLRETQWTEFRYKIWQKIYNTKSKTFSFIRAINWSICLEIHEYYSYNMLCYISMNLVQKRHQWPDLGPACRGCVWHWKFLSVSVLDDHHCPYCTWRDGWLFHMGSIGGWCRTANLCGPKLLIQC